MSSIEAILEKIAEPTILINKERDVIKAKQTALQAKEDIKRHKCASIHKEIRAVLWDYLIKGGFRKYDWLLDDFLNGINFTNKSDCGIYLVVKDDFKWLQDIIQQYSKLIGVSEFSCNFYTEELTISYTVPSENDRLRVRVTGSSKSVKDILTKLGINIVGVLVEEKKLTKIEKEEAKFAKEIRALCSKEN